MEDNGKAQKLLRTDQTYQQLYTDIATDRNARDKRRILITSMPQQHGTVENKRATTEGKKDEKKRAASLELLRGRDITLKPLNKWENHRFNIFWM